MTKQQSMFMQPGALTEHPAVSNGEAGDRESVIWS